MAAATPSFERAAAGAKSSSVRDFLHGPAKNLLIGGKWLPAKSGKSFETINPANEEVLAIAAEGDKADVDDAVKAARNAFENGTWPAMGPHQRARYLYKIADLVEAHREDLAELITLDNGKPISESDVEVTRTVDTFRYYAGWATKFYGETNPSDPGFFNYTLREPIGVCGQIVPWNGPALDIELESGAGHGLRQYDGAEAGRADAASRDPPRRADLRSGRARWRRQYRNRLRAGRGQLRSRSIPASTRSHSPGRTEVGKIILQASAGNLETRLARTRRQIAQRDLSLTPQWNQRSRSATGVFRNQGQVCCAATPHVRAGAHL